MTDHLHLRLSTRSGEWFVFKILSTTTIYCDRLDIDETTSHKEHSLDIDCFNDGIQVGNHHVETMMDALEPSIKIEVESESSDGATPAVPQLRWLCNACEQPISGDAYRVETREPLCQSCAEIEADDLDASMVKITLPADDQVIPATLQERIGEDGQMEYRAKALNGYWVKINGPKAPAHKPED